MMAESGTNPAVLEGDELLLSELLRGASLVDAARVAGLSERTARRRKADPEFQARIDAGRAELLSLLAVRAAADAERVAWPALVEIAEDGEERAADRIAAARYLIQYAIALGAARDLEARVETLERQAGVDGLSGRWKSAA